MMSIAFQSLLILATFLTGYFMANLRTDGSNNRLITDHSEQDMHQASVYIHELCEVISEPLENPSARWASGTQATRIISHCGLVA
jgi:hypothetical protein